MLETRDGQDFTNFFHSEPITISPKDVSSTDDKRRRRTTSIVANNPLEHSVGTEEFVSACSRYAVKFC